VLEAYCWPLSTDPGVPVGLHVSTDAGAIEVEVGREGAERDVVWRGGGAAGHHAVPHDASARGCGWPAALSLPVAEDWRSGYYDVTVTAGAERTHAFLVVRPASGTRAPAILVLSTATWIAYNDWGAPAIYTGGTRVSFERPLAKGFLDKPEPVERKMQREPDREAMHYIAWARAHGLSDWSGGAGWFQYERPFVQWAEANGHALDVATSQDLETHPGILDGHRLFLSVGHDEYWSWGMREAVDGFTGRGGHAAFLSGNTCFWQVRFDDDDRAMTGFKYRSAEDPVLGTTDERFLTGAWSDRRVAWPETSTIGLTFTRGGYSRYGLGVPRASGGYTVHRPDHWIYEGTGLRYGDTFGATDAIVSYEVDGCALTVADGLPVPTHEDGTPDSLEILATAPARLWSQDEQPSRYAHEPGELEHTAMALFGDDWRDHVHRLAANHAVLGVFGTAAGGIVVNVGVTDWVYGLVGRDPDVERITRTILDRLSR
jgi:hypothetical protein